MKWVCEHYIKTHVQNHGLPLDHDCCLHLCWLSITVPHTWYEQLITTRPWCWPMFLDVLAHDWTCCSTHVAGQFVTMCVCQRNGSLWQWAYWMAWAHIYSCLVPGKKKVFSWCQLPLLALIIFPSFLSQRSLSLLEISVICRSYLGLGNTTISYSLHVDWLRVCVNCHLTSRRIYPDEGG